MSKDLSIELARLKTQMQYVQKVSDLHRKLGEDTAFENRELHRGIEKTKERAREIYNTLMSLAAQIPAEETELVRLKTELESGMIDLISMLDKL